jgi:Tol biopolymer transport system component
MTTDPGFARLRPAGRRRRRRTGRELLYDAWRIFVVPAGGGEPRELFRGFIPTQDDPAWSPDGSRFAFNFGRTVSVVNVDGTGFRQITEGFNADWAPDGQTLVYANLAGPPVATNPVGSRMRIFILSDGNVERQVIPEAAAPAPDNYWDNNPPWSRHR